ncbi:MAG: hypothetical protein A3J29_11780 [Acidobacteria bacterium RIFCSPLOWO2_12_FULL_67_14b]|nr:MAG: hypothetical protein A3J29_11780 [Acidobacteria bacterium RIFCSPLOWO2_12_FULL_67_14b]
MTRFTAILAAFLAVAPPLAAAQTLADVAKAEEARRKAVKKPAKTYTNTDLRPDFTAPATPANATPATTEPTPTPGAAAVNIPLSPDPAAPAPPPQGDQAFWSGRMSTARTALERSRMFADALQSRINALNADFVNRDDPAQRAVIEADRLKALAELDRVKKEIADQQKAIAAIEDEARRAGIPLGWIR